MALRYTETPQAHVPCLASRAYVASGNGSRLENDPSLEKRTSTPAYCPPPQEEVKSEGRRIVSFYCEPEIMSSAEQDERKVVLAPLYCKSLQIDTKTKGRSYLDGSGVSDEDLKEKELESLANDKRTIYLERNKPDPVIKSIEKAKWARAEAPSKPSFWKRFTKVISDVYYNI